MAVYPGFHGDSSEFWDESVDRTPECLPSTAAFTKRQNPVVIEQIARRERRFGRFMIRVLGDLVRSNSNFRDLYSQLANGPDQSFTGFLLGTYEEFWNALCYLSAPVGERDKYWQSSAFFLQLCSVDSILHECKESLMELAPPLMENPTPGQPDRSDWASEWTDDDGESNFVRFESPSDWFQFFVLDDLDDEYDRIIDTE